jgi:NAD(P)-dependent dehydrogenase (short-subunit alcohol dehydrogenase family)
MQYFGVFDLANANSGRNAYANNKLYFQTWLTELQARMEKHAKYKHIMIQGVHPGYVKTNIWVAPQTTISENTTQQNTRPPKMRAMSWLEWSLRVLLRYYGIDAQQGSLAITNAAAAVDLASGGRYTNRIWEEKPMPQTMHPACRHQVWQFVSEELLLEDRGLLNELGAQ